MQNMKKSGNIFSKFVDLLDYLFYRLGNLARIRRELDNKASTGLAFIVLLLVLLFHSVIVFPILWTLGIDSDKIPDKVVNIWGFAITMIPAFILYVKRYDDVLYQKLDKKYAKDPHRKRKGWMVAFLVAIIVALYGFTCYILM